MHLLGCCSGGFGFVSLGIFVACACSSQQAEPVGVIRLSTNDSYRVKV